MKGTSRDNAQQKKDKLKPSQGTCILRHKKKMEKFLVRKVNECCFDNLKHQYMMSRTTKLMSLEHQGQE